MKDTDLNQIIKNNLTALQNVDVNSVERIALEILALKNNGGTLSGSYYDMPWRYSSPREINFFVRFDFN